MVLLKGIDSQAPTFFVLCNCMKIDFLNVDSFRRISMSFVQKKAINIFGKKIKENFQFILCKKGNFFMVSSAMVFGK